jgi:DNA-binding transcriptional LysR family regulator
LSETKAEPSGLLRVTANQGFGSFWLTSHLQEFLDRYPDITINLLVLDGELDLGMREADVAIRLTPPSKPDLIQKKLRTAHTHLYASPSYMETAPPLEIPDDLDRHRLIDYGTGITPPPPVPSLNWILEAGRDEDDPRPPREPALSINNVYGMLRAAQKGAGVASLPDYLGSISNRLVRVLPQLEGPSFDVYFVYPEEMRASARIGVFRDFLLQKMGEQQVW